MKKYSNSYHRTVNLKHVSLLIGLGIISIVVIIGAVWFLYRTLFYDPFPEDASMTKQAGNLTQEIDDEKGWMVRYPVFDDAAIDDSISQIVDESKEAADADQQVVLDYRSKVVYDHYISVLFKETVKSEDQEQIVYRSVNYDKKQKQLLKVDTILRNQYSRDLLDGAADNDVKAVEINEQNVLIYLDGQQTKTIDYSKNKEYIALTDPNIPSLYQKEPLTVEKTKEIDPDKPMVALTFDDGPNPNTTPQLLDTLKKYNAHATFFMLGTNVKYNPELVARVYQEGHEIGNHSWEHKDFARMTDKDEIWANYQKADDAIFEACGHDPTHVRPPYGSVSELYNKVVNRDSILWSIDTRDWESHDPKAIQAIIEKYVNDGSVILLHDIHIDSVEAMETVIPMLQKKGYQLVTIDDLYRYGKI